LEILVNFIMGLENFDEEAVMSRIEEDLLREELEEFHRDFFLYYDNGLNYGANF